MSAIQSELVLAASIELAVDRSELHVSQQSFSVSYQFPVIFCTGVFCPNSRVLAEVVRQMEPLGRHRLLVFVDAGLLEARPTLFEEIVDHVGANGAVLELAAAPVAIAGGESIKQGLETILEMQRLMVEHRIDRHSYVVAIGGGAVLDAVGLAAATAHRGIRHIRIPTTVLSQNDSGVGVKNGVNLFGAKNYFGTFAPPSAVINDYDFIESLPVREKRAGIAEAIKVALIRDRRFFEWLESSVEALHSFDPTAMRYMIRRCAELHMHQIGQGGDPFERGTARPLDFGHWAAHRLEMLSEFSVRHGEAVAIGIALDTEYSVLVGLLGEEDAARVRTVLKGLGFSLWHDLMEANAADGSLLMQGLREFQEHLGGELTITLLAALGTGLEVHDISEPLMLQAIANLKQRAAMS
ncbi:3-dehydroquinate synthase [Pelagibacterium luteolum]|uniref:3-dehydroquinate synthase n=1 Tax=Pelagibacterium luteolum TaxID=440168 RepID=A0A1G7SUE8_9HYPH|nr:3-dehydroquinate synthase [Pelagibacterium luteolum]SDG26665.1 3-dehydroquinate synthase [Pelagibacterium luteolum]